MNQLLKDMGIQRVREDFRKLCAVARIWNQFISPEGLYSLSLAKKALERVTAAAGCLSRVTPPTYDEIADLEEEDQAEFIPTLGDVPFVSLDVTAKAHLFRQLLRFSARVQWRSAMTELRRQHDLWLVIRPAMSVYYTLKRIGLHKDRYDKTTELANTMGDANSSTVVAFLAISVEFTGYIPTQRIEAPGQDDLAPVVDQQSGGFGNFIDQFKAGFGGMVDAVTKGSKDQKAKALAEMRPLLLGIQTMDDNLQDLIQRMNRRLPVPAGWGANARELEEE